MSKDKDPLEGFNIVGYDEATKVVTIKIHQSIIQNKKQQNALVEKMIEAINYGDGEVEAANIEPRDS